MTEIDRFNRAFEALIDHRNYYEAQGTDNDPDISVWAGLEPDPTRLNVRVPIIGHIATYKMDGVPGHSKRTGLYRHPGLITIAHSVGIPKPADPTDIIWSFAAGVPLASRPQFVNFGLIAVESALSSILSPAA